MKCLRCGKEIKESYAHNKECPLCLKCLAKEGKARLQEDNNLIGVEYVPSSEIFDKETLRVILDNFIDIKGSVTTLRFPLLNITAKIKFSQDIDLDSDKYQDIADLLDTDAIIKEDDIGYVIIVDDSACSKEEANKLISLLNEPVASKKERIENTDIDSLNIELNNIIREFKDELYSENANTNIIKEKYLDKVSKAIFSYQGYDITLDALENLFTVADTTMSNILSKYPEEETNNSYNFFATVTESLIEDTQADMNREDVNERLNSLRKELATAIKNERDAGTSDENIKKYIASSKAPFNRKLTLLLSRSYLNQDELLVARKTFEKLMTTLDSEDKDVNFFEDCKLEEEAELFAAQYGESNLRVVKEKFEQNELEFLGVILEFKEGKNDSIYQSMKNKLVSLDRMNSYLVSEDEKVQERIQNDWYMGYDKAYIDFIFKLDEKVYRAHLIRVYLGDGVQPLDQDDVNIIKKYVSEFLNGTRTYERDIYEVNPANYERIKIFKGESKMINKKEIKEKYNEYLDDPKFNDNVKNESLKEDKDIDADTERKLKDQIYRLESQLRNDKTYNDRGVKYSWAIRAEKKLEELKKQLSDLESKSDVKNNNQGYFYKGIKYLFDKRPVASLENLANLFDLDQEDTIQSTNGIVDDMFMYGYFELNKIESIDWANDAGLFYIKSKDENFLASGFYQTIGGVEGTRLYGPYNSDGTEIEESFLRVIKEKFEGGPIDFVKNYLSSLKVDNKIRSLKNDEKLPRGFSFKSSTGKEGEVTYKGIDYAWAIMPKTKELKVMKSSDAGNNWSETIFKESSIKNRLSEGDHNAKSKGYEIAERLYKKYNELADPLYRHFDNEESEEDEDFYEALMYINRNLIDDLIQMRKELEPFRDGTIMYEEILGLIHLVNTEAAPEKILQRMLKIAKDRGVVRESFKVVDAKGKKVVQGGGFSTKKEAESFAAQYGEPDLRVVKEYLDNNKNLKESLNNLDYDINLAAYMYDNIDVNINRHGYLTFDEDVLTYEDVIDYYDDRITKKEFKNTKSIVVKALQQDDLKFYTSYHSDTLIELSDNHTLWDIKVPIDEEGYGIMLEQYLEKFTQETGVEVFTEGRSGRHICVHNTVENLIRFEELQTIQQKLESEMIDHINTNYDKENINESQSNITESNEMEDFKEINKLKELQEIDYGRSSDGEDMIRLLKAKTKQDKDKYFVVGGYYFDILMATFDKDKAYRKFDRLTREIDESIELKDTDSRADRSKQLYNKDESLKESYSRDLLEELINTYMYEYNEESHERIWDEIFKEYNDEDLANDVLAALESHEGIWDDLADDVLASLEDQTYRDNDGNKSLKEEDSYLVVTIDSSYKALITSYSNNFGADSVFSELLKMSDEELKEIDVIAFMQLEKDETGAYLIDSYYVGDVDESKVKDIIRDALKEEGYSQNIK